MRQGKRIRKWLVGLAAAATIAPAAFAAGTSSDEAAIRATHPLGAYLTAWGDPFPALVGANLAYNVYDFLRVNGGIGTESTNNISVTTFGLGAKLMLPNAALSPVVGVNWSADRTSNNRDVTMRAIRRGGNRFYGNAGIDWQTTLGLSLGAGYNAAFNDIGGGTFYLSAGWYL